MFSLNRIQLIGHQTHKHTPPSRLLSPSWHTPPHQTISTSETYSSIIREALHLDSSSLPVTGYPRNDVLLRDVEDSDLGAVPLPRVSSTRRILYVPTFRPDGSNPLDHLDLCALFDFLRAHDASLYMSLHPKLAAYRPQWEERFGERMYFIDGGRDLYPFLRSFDVCITDYSSTATDYLLLDRPVVYYQYDRSEYEQVSGLQTCEGVLTPGPHCATFDELAAALAQIFLGNDAYAEARVRARECAFAQRDGDSAARVFQTILKDAGLVDAPLL